MAQLSAGYTQLPGLQVSAYGSILSNLKVYTSSINPASVAANTTAEQTFTITGLLADDIVLAVIKPTASAGLGICGYRVSAANTLAITFNNNTAAPIDAGAETYTVVVINSYLN